MSMLSQLLNKITDDWLGMNPPAQPTVPQTAPAPIEAAKPDLQEVISVGDRARKKKATATSLGGNSAAQPSISPAVLYGL
jgi:hypothetical protein